MENLRQQSLAALRHVVLDLDGTVYMDGQLFPSTQPFLDLLRRSDIGYTFVTNNNVRSSGQYLEMLRAAGLEVSTDQLFTSAHATIAYIARELPACTRPFILGAEGLIAEFEIAGFRHDDVAPDLVVVGFPVDLQYDQLSRAAYWISQGLPYLATHPDMVCPTNQPRVLPDCGAFCRLLEAATSRTPDAVPGKPDPAMIRGVIDQRGLEPGQVAMVGDRLYTDVQMAVSAGVLGVLTLTGEATREDLVDATVQPDLVVTDLGDLGKQIAAARNG